MSRAFTNPVFQRDYETMASLESQVRQADPRRCLRCHAPMAVIAEGGRTDSALARDGVTCDLCHAVALIRDKPGAAALGIDPRGVRYGADTRPRMEPHPMRASEALRDPRLCAACHHDVLPGGVPLERTFLEWRRSPYAEQGVVCVDCHMRPAGEDEAGLSHRFHGGHAGSPLLPGAATVSLSAPAGGAFEVAVVNAAVGHHFPTAGAHPNRLLLRVALHDAAGESLWQGERVYRFTYLDAEGDEADGLTPIASVRDTTLAPLEPRIERFEPPELAAARRIEAELVYQLVPPEHRERIGAERYEQSYRPVTVDRASLTLPPP